MRPKYFFAAMTVASVLFLGAVAASGQVGQLRGNVQLIGADGKPAPVVGALVDVYRTEITGEYHTKTDKRGDWVFAGLPISDTYVVTASAPGARPHATPNAKAGHDVPVNIVLQPGDGSRYTMAQAKEAAKSGSSSSGGSVGGGGGESSDSKAKREEAIRKNAEILKANARVVEANKIVEDSFKAANAAMIAKNYDEAIRQSELGIAADPEQAALWTVKAQSHTNRGVTRFNAAVTNKDEAARTEGTNSAKEDFKSAAEASAKAVTIAKAEQPATDPAEVARQAGRRLVALTIRAEAMRLFVSKVDQTQAAAGTTAYEEYMAAETDPVKKAKAQRDLAKMLFDAYEFGKAREAYQELLAANPDDVEALVYMGMALFNEGAFKAGEGKKDEAKAKYQEAANYLQHFVEKATDDNTMKKEAKDILDELKNQQNVKAEKITAPPRRRRP